MILSLAYVPKDDVIETFNLISETMPQELDAIVKYFRKTYVEGILARGRRKARQPRYPPRMWNQYTAAQVGDHRTNNVSEGWHNRFRLLVGKNHPDVYNLINEFQKEQADSEIHVQEFHLGRKLKAGPKKKWVLLQNRVKTIVANYNTFKDEDNVLEYLRLLSNNAVI